MSHPFLQGLVRTIDAPKVDEFALSCDGNLLCVLPLDFDALELWVDIAVVEAGDLFAVSSAAVPDIDLTHDASCGDKMVGLVAKLALHQAITELLGLLNIDPSFAIYSPYASHLIRGAREQLVTTVVPVERADGRVLIVMLLISHVRNLLLFQIAEVVSSQVPQMGDEPVACSRQQTVLRVELS